LYAHLAGSQRCENDFHLTSAAFFLTALSEAEIFQKLCPLL